MQTSSLRLSKCYVLLSHPGVLSLFLMAAAAALYAPFLENPLVFDDKSLFATSVLTQALTPSLLDSRWVSYASLAWTRELFGSGLIAFRLGNLILHAANAVLLFLFLRRLFQLSLPAAPAAQTSRPYGWLAFLSGLLFALHPVAVYAAAYLVQRSMLMATLFCLLMWFAYVEGLTRNKQSLLLVSALFYYLAVFSKELSVMAPAVALGATLLLRKPTLALVKSIAPTFLLYAGIALLAILNALNIIGTAYEPLAKTGLMKVPEHALLLSAVNQSFLFFKYLLLWIVPYPGWMSVDIRVPFPGSPFSFPQALGPLAYVLVVVCAILMLQRGSRAETRLAGFALLAPALMFMTEFSTVRIQEPFVLYRSYLWFGLIFAALPAFSRYIGAKRLTTSLAALSIVLIPASWNRMTTFSDPVLLWTDAATLVESNPHVLGADRIYYNRGNALLMRGQTEEAAQDYNRALELNSKNQGALNNRAFVHYENGRYREAVVDYRAAIDLNPRARRPYYGAGMSYRALKEGSLSRDYFRRACGMKYEPACQALLLP